MYNESLDIKNKQNSRVVKELYNIFTDFVSTQRDQMIGITTRVKTFQDLQEDVAGSLP